MARAVETPPIFRPLQAMLAQVQNALPGILSLTNKLPPAGQLGDATST